MIVKCNISGIEVSQDQRRWAPCCEAVHQGLHISLIFTSTFTFERWLFFLVLIFFKVSISFHTQYAIYPLNPCLCNQRGHRLHQQLSAMVARAPYEPNQSTQVANTSNKQTQVANT